MPDSARQIDHNGFIEIKDNPISKSGIFQYLGKHIDSSLDPETIYNVYRPSEELSNPETINSFRLVPWVDIHPNQLMGANMPDRITSEEKPIKGVTGEDIYFKGDTLYSNLKLFSEDLGDIIDSGERRELSVGYGCTFELSSGIFEGVPYTAIQRNIRGNHLAAVSEGRAGPDVAVLDHLVFTFDAKDITMAKEEEKKELTADEVTNWIKENGPKMSKMKDAISKYFANDASKEEKEKKEADDKSAKDKAAKDESEEEEKKKADDAAKCAADKKAKDEEESEKKESEAKDKAMDAKLTAITGELEALKKGTVKALLGHVKQRDQLASRISQFVGSFDHSDMTVEEVAVYGAEKLGLKPPKGSEIVALDAYLTNRPIPTEDFGFALDAGTGDQSGGVSALDKIFQPST